MPENHLKQKYALRVVDPLTLAKLAGFVLKNPFTHTSIALVGPRGT